MCPIATTSLPLAPISPSVVDQLVGAVADGAEAEQEACAGASYAAHDLEQGLEPGLVVGEVHDDGEVVAVDGA